MPFTEELNRYLPDDLPDRDAVILKAALHLQLIVTINRQFNLTRITDPREAVIKHVVDSVLPWRLFAEAKHILDAGTGPGFPGIPLALVLPERRFTLSESVGKKARFVESAISELGLQNVTVATQRAEDVLRTQTIDVVTARAVAPIGRALDLFGPAVKMGSRALLYKGPDAGDEIAAAEAEIRKHKVRVRVLDRYELPEAFGSRTIVEVTQ
ncbi:MAG: 16S rRNA (guanine(527)-N(7))-methyltransferase RsmG [Bryobacteraceae bacterium]|nr:16S rRNA (guanine(527)-N(7))-methyltransferase RsmG [Bryobacteraceae bacterium]